MPEGLSARVSVACHQGGIIFTPPSLASTDFYTKRELTGSQSMAEIKRVTKDPQERRRELIDTAERLFLTQGYDQTSVSDIVREINISQGAYYYYFDSKEDVLVAILEKNVAAMVESLRQTAIRTDLDEAVKLNAMINQFISISASGKKILSYIHHEKNARLRKKLLKVRPFARIAPELAEVISKGVEKGRFDVARPLETSYLLIMLLGSVLRMISFPEMAGATGQDNERRESMRMALEDLLGRALGVSDYRFILQI
jgi:AcrR family transcriptional regulator